MLRRGINTRLAACVCADGLLIRDRTACASSARTNWLGREQGITLICRAADAYYNGVVRAV